MIPSLNIIKKHKVILENMLFVGLVQVFGLIAPLITFPYLTKVLGMQTYGIVLTAQMLVSYATLIIDFGSNSVCAKNISIYRNNKLKIAEIINAVLLNRFFLWIICFFVYILIVCLVPIYRDFSILFIFSYLLTINELLFPQFYFQGIEKLKIVSLLNILTRLIFIVLIFFIVKDQDDFIYVPILYALGYLVAGLIALYIIYVKNDIKFFIPKFSAHVNCFKECFPILAKDLICTIKDKLNYMFVGSFMGMENVVVYDLGLKFIGIMSKPSTIITTVLLPRFAHSRNVRHIKYVISFVFLLSVCMFFFLNIFMEQIVSFFIDESIDIFPLRLFSIAPVFLCPSVVISNNFFIGFGYNKYILYSILVTVTVYVILLIVIWLFGYINSIYSFIFLALICYFVEFIYRLLAFNKLTHQN